MIQSLKLNLSPRIIFEIIQKLQTEVTWFEVKKTVKSRPSEVGKNRIL
jgi:hypothetical protein